MPDPGSLLQELVRFGLTGKQAEIYLLLAGRRELRVQDIAKLAQIPRTSVYRNLDQLYYLGLAEEVIQDTFKLVRANPVTVLKHDLDEKIQALQRQAGRLDNLEKAIDASAVAAPGPTGVSYYKGRSGARQIIWNTLKAGNTVYVYSEWGRQKYVGLKFYENFAAQNADRGLQEKVLINLSPHILQSIERYTLPGSTIARTKIEDIRVLDPSQVRIKGDTMIYDEIYAQVYLRNVEVHGFEIRSADFVDTQRSIFETLWEQAKPVTDFMSHI